MNNLTRLLADVALKPCPFCGGAVDATIGCNNYLSIRCPTPGCGVSSIALECLDHYATPKATIAALVKKWNTRAYVEHHAEECDQWSECPCYILGREQGDESAGARA